MSTRLRIAIAAVAVSCVIALSLLLILHDGARGLVLDPIVHGINSARSTLNHVSQALQWLIVLLTVSLLVIGYVVPRLPKRRRRVDTAPTPSFPTEGPTMRLARIVDESRRYNHRRVGLILELRDVAARVQAHHHSLSVDEAKDTLDTTDWTDDSEVRVFLSTDQHRPGLHDRKRLHEQVDRALAQIERMYREV